MSTATADTPTTDATTTDGATTQETTTATTTEKAPVLPERESVMEQITRQNEERMLAEHKERGITIEGLAEASTTTPPQDQLQTQLEADKPTVLDSGLDKIMVKQVVDGEERLVSVAELNVMNQKQAAIDKRLAESAHDRREAARILEEAKARAATTTTPPENDTTGAAKDITGTEPSAEEAKALRKQFRDALFEGDEAKVDEAMEKLGIGRPTPVAPTPAVQVDAAQVALQVKQQLSVDSALEKFSLEHPDIVSDPVLDQMTAGFIQAEMDGGKPFVEALAPAAKRTREWLASKGVAPAATTTSTMDRTQKLERKEGIDNVQSLNTKATTVEETVPTASDVIAEMRKSRGLA